MITKEIATSLHVGAVLHHISEKNADGTPMRCRVSGKCKTWKRKPDLWRLPVKYGLKTSFAIWPNKDTRYQSAANWELP